MPPPITKSYSVVGNIRLHASNNSMSTSQPTKNISLNIQSTSNNAKNKSNVKCTQCDMLQLINNGNTVSNTALYGTRRCDACHTVRSNKSQQSYAYINNSNKPQYHTKSHKQLPVDVYDAVDVRNDNLLQSQHNQATNLSHAAESIAGTDQHSIDTVEVGQYYITQLELLYANNIDYNEFNKLVAKFHKLRSGNDTAQTSELLLLLIRCIHCAWQLTNDKLSRSADGRKQIASKLHILTEQYNHSQDTVRQQADTIQHLQHKYNELQDTVQSNITHYESKLIRREHKLNELQDIVNDLTRVYIKPQQYNEPAPPANNYDSLNRIPQMSSQYAESTIADNAQYITATLQTKSNDEHNDALHDEIDALKRELNAVKLQNQADRLRKQVRHERKLLHHNKQQAAVKQQQDTVQKPVSVSVPVQYQPQLSPVADIMPTPQSPQQQLSYSTHVVEAAIQRSKLLREQYNKLQQEQQEHLLQLATQELAADKHINTNANTNTVQRVDTQPQPGSHTVSNSSAHRQRSNVYVSDEKQQDNELITDSDQLSSITESDDDDTDAYATQTSGVEEMGKYTLYKLKGILSGSERSSHKNKLARRQRSV